MEKLILLILLTFTLISSLILFRHHYLITTREIADEGGTYTEGILVDSLPSLSDALASLTHIGLTRLGEDGSIKPAIAKSWQISEDGKSYTFQLDNRYSSSQIATYLKNQQGSWSNIQILTPSKSTIQFNLKQPYGLFLASTLRPVLPYGPYKITDQNSKQITLKVSENALHKPYINKVVFKVYATKEELKKALDRGKILATGESISPASTRIRIYSLSLPRHTAAFLNTKKTSLTDKNIRGQIINGPALDQSLTLNLLRANTASSANFTEALKAKLAKNNVKINETVVENAALLTEEARKNQYDILIYGYNAGYYDDLYPYWHSSQFSPQGLNFSFFKGKDTDRLIEDARLTLDDNVRSQKFSQAKALINAENIVVFDMDDPYQFYVNKKVKGISIKSAVAPSDRFSFLDFWYINTRRVKK